MTLSLKTLDKPIAELAELAPADLYGLQEALAGEAEALKRRKAAFEATMLRLFEQRIRSAYIAEKKDTGTVHVPASNTLDLAVEVDKTVVWDQAKLRAALDAMTPDDARHYAKITIEVPEAKFKSAVPRIQAALGAARTIKAGRMKFTLKPMPQDEAA